MKRFATIVATLTAAVAAAVALSTGAAAQQDRPFTPVTDAMLQNPAPGDWLTWRRTLDGWGYSPLDQVDRANVDDLRMVWTRGLTLGSNQGTPLVYNGVMYMPNPGDVIQAIDGPLMVTACSTDNNDCDQYSKCSIRDPLWQIRERIAATLDTVTIAEMAAESNALQAPAALAAVMKR